MFSCYDELAHFVILRQEMPSEVERNTHLQVVMEVEHDHMTDKRGLFRWMVSTEVTGVPLFLARRFLFRNLPT
ncbi:hypothetical protein CEXT_463611 [Caerostris extrusa]|uniref:Uncharacterized protein n=1 Tax=Caerostris extrusa TaxID=172846 RepID=A0AAV4UPD0_CAEEX|nr:hypothetical protein CEXT_463611 [Caerostris extrusa]